MNIPLTANIHPGKITLLDTGRYASDAHEWGCDAYTGVDEPGGALITRDGKLFAMHGCEGTFEAYGADQLRTLATLLLTSADLMDERKLEAVA